MVAQIKDQFADQVGQVLAWMNDFERTGLVGIDALSLHTRNDLQANGVL